MTLGIGIIGAGVMGGDHARTVARHVAGARVAAISDTDAPRLAAIAGELGVARTYEASHAVIADPNVDAVVVASPDATHCDLVLACLAAGKPVLCEKPLAATREDCLRIVAAEAALGRTLVQVGFMRRFDPAYVAMKGELHRGALGHPLLFHCAHRNASAPPWFEAVLSITNAAVHEFDISRWLLGTEIARIQVLRGAKSSAAGFRDPTMMVLTTDKDQLVDVEVFMNGGYGYDIRGELVCERGSIALAPPVLTDLRHGGGQSFGFAADWRPRFAAAYRIQLQSWVNAIAGHGHYHGASAWDGYVATEVALAGVRSLETGMAEDVTLAERPAFYA
jgi:myo-inositol 2-dehydrogenase / D-chiro-inositol 1-dehydrogenase